MRIVDKPEKFFKIEHNKRVAYADVIVRNVAIDMFNKNNAHKIEELTEDVSDEALEYINFDGQTAYYKGSDEYSVFIWDNGDYIFVISGNLTKTEIVELAKTPKMKK